MLSRSFAFLAALAFIVSPVLAESLKLDKEKSKVDFVGKKSDGKHTGGFKEFKVDAKADFENPEKSSLMIEIDTTSLFSDDAKLTDHLKNPDFFDVRKYPKITFESTKIDATEESATITGKLTMLDKTVEVKVPCKTTVTDSSIQLKAEFKIDRTKWGMNYGKGKINDEVEINATMEFTR
jgi:polyisoprenoid-binding protein YceI